MDDARRQADIFKAMEDPGFYPHPVSEVRQMETHISRVFLTGSLVYKIKKPVDLGFLDFTTIEKRKRYCLREVELNRRLSRDVYLGVEPITRQEDRYRLGGPAEPVEYAVKMRQLPEEATMARLLEENRLPDRFVRELAGILHRFYETASSGPDISRIGSWDTVRTNCEENFTQLSPFCGIFFSQRTLQIVQRATRAFLKRRRSFFEDRIAGGKIRDGHGDLRPDHIYFIDGIQIIDCIEFNERFRYGDTACDLAFLAMDLDFRGYPDTANLLLKAYVDHSGDGDIYILLDFYRCYRALVRVKVDCFRLEETRPDPGEKNRLADEITRYVELAYRYAVSFTRPTLWVICGMIAAGKSTIARELARITGAQTIRSDQVRKELLGLPVHESRVKEYGRDIYSREATSLTYGKILLTAQDELKKGNSVILDATFARSRHRREAVRLAGDMDVNVIFVECICPEGEIRRRLQSRERQGSDSDARLRHFEGMKADFEPLEEIEKDLRIRVRTERPLAECIREILAGEQRSEDRDQRSEVRGQMTEDREQMTKERGGKP